MLTPITYGSDLHVNEAVAGPDPVPRPDLLASHKLLAISAKSKATRYEFMITVT